VTFLIRKRITGVFISVKDLIKKMDFFIERYNLSPNPFKWFRTPQEIMTKVQRPARAA